MSTHDEKIDKISEQIVIMGEHFSHLSKSIVELKDETRALRERQDTGYSNREIDVFFTSIVKTLEEIKTQVYKTNGKVLKQEFYRYATTTVLSVLIPVLVYMYYTEIGYLKDKIDSVNKTPAIIEQQPNSRKSP